MRALDEARDGLIARWQLGQALRAAREAAGRTQGDLALALGWSLSTMVRAEKGSGVSATDLRAFLGECGVTDRLTAERLADLARAGRARPWHKERGTAGLYLSCETAATAIAGHHPYLVPPLLQTEGYARALAEGLCGWPQLERLASLLLERQARADAASPRRSLLRYTIAEEALYRTIGGNETWKGQIRHLQDLADSGRAEIRIVPFEAGAIPTEPAAFTVFEIGADLLAFTGWTSPETLEDNPQRATALRRQADDLAETALSPSDSARCLSQIAARARRPEPAPARNPRRRAAPRADASGPELALLATVRRHRPAHRLQRTANQILPSGQAVTVVSRPPALTPCTGEVRTAAWIPDTYQCHHASPRAGRPRPTRCCFAGRCAATGGKPG